MVCLQVLVYLRNISSRFFFAVCVLIHGGRPSGVGGVFSHFEEG